jgi:hypothetical protein
MNDLLMDKEQKSYDDNKCGNNNHSSHDIVDSYRYNTLFK